MLRPALSREVEPACRVNRRRLTSEVSPALHHRHLSRPLRQLRISRARYRDRQDRRHRCARRQGDQGGGGASRLDADRRVHHPSPHRPCRRHPGAEARNRRHRHRPARRSRARSSGSTCWSAAAIWSSSGRPSSSSSRRRGTRWATSPTTTRPAGTCFPPMRCSRSASAACSRASPARCGKACCNCAPCPTTRWSIAATNTPLANAQFALSVDPRNAALNIRAAEVKRLRESGQATIPVGLGIEKAANPFLRADQPVLAKAMGLAPTLLPNWCSPRCARPRTTSRQP